MKKYGRDHRCGEVHRQLRRGLSRPASRAARREPQCQRNHDAGYCTPVFNALKAAGKPAIPAVCYATTARCRHVAPASSVRDPDEHPGEVQLAMQIALKVSRAEAPARQHDHPYPMYLYVSPTPKVTLSTSLPVQVLS